MTPMNHHLISQISSMKKLKMGSEGSTSESQGPQVKNWARATRWLGWQRCKISSTGASTVELHCGAIGVFKGVLK